MALEPRIVRTSTLLEFKRSGRKIAALTSYDFLTAAIFDKAGVDVLLVGDSAADNSLGYESTLPITLDEMIPFGRAVDKAAERALVVVDLPFGSYEAGAEQALATGVRVMKETGAAAVKLEGGARSIEQLQDYAKTLAPMGQMGLKLFQQFIESGSAFGGKKGG